MVICKGDKEFRARWSQLVLKQGTNSMNLLPPEFVQPVPPEGSQEVGVCEEQSPERWRWGSILAGLSRSFQPGPATTQQYHVVNGQLTDQHHPAAQSQQPEQKGEKLLGVRPPPAQHHSTHSHTNTQCGALSLPLPSTLPPSDFLPHPSPSPSPLTPSPPLSALLLPPGLRAAAQRSD